MADHKCSKKEVSPSTDSAQIMGFLVGLMTEFGTRDDMGPVVCSCLGCVCMFVCICVLCVCICVCVGGWVRACGWVGVSCAYVYAYPCACVGTPRDT